MGGSHKLPLWAGASPGGARQRTERHMTLWTPIGPREYPPPTQAPTQPSVNGPDRIRWSCSGDLVYDLKVAFYGTSYGSGPFTDGWHQTCVNKTDYSYLCFDRPPLHRIRCLPFDRIGTRQPGIMRHQPAPTPGPSGLVTWSITKLVRTRSCRTFPRMARYAAIWLIEVQPATSCQMGAAK